MPEPTAPLTIQGRLAQLDGHPSGFDYMRLILACSVVVWHTVIVSYGPAVHNGALVGPLRPLIGLILPLFFALSGFLVAGSLERSPGLITFLSLRVLRIFPALTAEVILSALLLGPLVTNLTLGEYVRDPMFASYFWNIVGHIHFNLPGVFSTNPMPGMVNGQLWTVPYELECYVALAGMALFGLVRRRILFLGAVGLVQAAFAARAIFGSAAVETTVFGRVLVLAFLAAVALYVYRDKVRYSLPLALVCLAVTVALFMVQNGSYLIAFPVAYLTVYLGLLNPPRMRFLTKGDYSYGIFLYGFPVQQAVAYGLGAWSHHWVLNALLSAPFILLVAMVSWHGLEKHVLRLRRYLPAIEGAARVRLGGLRRRFLPAASGSRS